MPLTGPNAPGLPRHFQPASSLTEQPAARRTSASHVAEVGDATLRFIASVAPKGRREGREGRAHSLLGRRMALKPRLDRRRTNGRSLVRLAGELLVPHGFDFDDD